MTTFKTFLEAAKKFKLGTKVGNDGKQEPAYGFEHEGMFIHNPYESSCGRFLAKPSDYGLSNAEAKQLVNMNNLLTVKKLIKKPKLGESKVVKSTNKSLAKACWTGYTAVGTKMKNGKRVPNCVPESTKTDDDSVENKPELPALLRPQAGPKLSKYEKKQIKQKLKSGKTPSFLKRQAESVDIE